MVFKKKILLLSFDEVQRELMEYLLRMVSEYTGSNSANIGCFVEILPDRFVYKVIKGPFKSSIFLQFFRNS